MLGTRVGLNSPISEQLNSSDKFCEVHFSTIKLQLIKVGMFHFQIWLYESLPLQRIQEPFVSLLPLEEKISTLRKELNLLQLQR
jgi:hypothetical protein